MYGGSGVAVAAPDEKLCPRTLVARFQNRPLAVIIM